MEKSTGRRQLREYESVADIARVAIANGCVDLVQCHFNKVLDRVKEFSSKIIETANSVLEDKEVKLQRHADPLNCLPEASSSRTTSVRGSVGHTPTLHWGPVASSATTLRSCGNRLSGTRSTGGSKTSVAKRLPPAVMKGLSANNSSNDKSISRQRSSARNSAGGRTSREFCALRVGKRNTCSVGEMGTTRGGSAECRQSGGSSGAGACATERWSEAPPMVVVELTDDEVKKTLAELERGGGVSGSYYELLHIHSCRNAVCCAKRVGGNGVDVEITGAEPQMMYNAQETQCRRHEAANSSSCFVTSVFTDNVDMRKDLVGDPSENFLTVATEYDGTEGSPPRGLSGSPEDGTGDIFICPDAFFKGCAHPGERTTDPSPYLTREITELPVRVLHSWECSAGEGEDGKNETAGVVGAPVVVWQPPASLAPGPHQGPHKDLKVVTRHDVIKINRKPSDEGRTGGDAVRNHNVFVLGCGDVSYALFTVPPPSHCCRPPVDTVVSTDIELSTMIGAAVPEDGSSSCSVSRAECSDAGSREELHEFGARCLSIELRVTPSPSLRD